MPTVWGRGQPCDDQRTLLYFLDQLDHPKSSRNRGHVTLSWAGGGQGRHNTWLEKIFLRFALHWSHPRFWVFRRKVSGLVSVLAVSWGHTGH